MHRTSTRAALVAAALALAPLAVVGSTPSATASTSAISQTADTAVERTAEQRLRITSKAPRRIDAGEPFTLRGEATPGLRGDRVVLERRISGSWRMIAMSRITKGLKYGVTASISDGDGDMRFRTSVRRGPKKQAITSKPVTIAFSGWYRLASLATTTSPGVDPSTVNFQSVGKPRVDGKQYFESYASRAVANGFSGFERGEANFDLQRQCTRLQSTIGLRDDAGASASWSFSVLRDSVETSYGYLSKGETQTVAEDLTAVGILTLRNLREVTPPDGEAQYADAVWAGARLECTERPM